MFGATAVFCSTKRSPTTPFTGERMESASTWRFRLRHQKSLTFQIQFQSAQLEIQEFLLQLGIARGVFVRQLGGPLLIARLFVIELRNAFFGEGQVRPSGFPLGGDE